MPKGSNSARNACSPVRTKDFIKAVSKSREPKAQKAIRAIFTKTTDVDLLLAALPAYRNRADRSLIRIVVDRKSGRFQVTVQRLRSDRARIRVHRSHRLINAMLYAWTCFAGLKDERDRRVSRCCNTHSNSFWLISDPRPQCR
jgi:hypothetical protein